MVTIVYKGFEVSPAPYQLAETGQWGVRVVVTRHHDNRSETLEKSFTAENTCSSCKEAESLAIKFGKKIIDGECSGLSVSALL